MPVAKTLIVLVTAIGGIIGLGVAWYAWQRRDVVSARWFAALMLLVGLWAFGHTSVYLSPTAGVATVALEYSITIAVVLPVLWVVWAAKYTGSDGWLSRRVLGVLFLETAIYVGFLLTRSMHGLMSLDVRMESTNGLTLPAYEYQGIGFVQWIVSIALVLVGIGLLVRYYVRAKSVFRRQAGIIVLGTIGPVVGTTVFLVGFSPHPGLDPTSLAMAGLGLVVGWALFRYDFLEVAPIARDLLVEELPDPVLVLDENDRVVDYNPVAGTLLPDGGSTADRERALANQVIDVVADDSQFEHRAPSAAGEGPELTIYEPIETPIVDHRDVRRGRLILLRDVTYQEQRQRTLEELQTATRQFMAATTPTEVAADLVEAFDRLLDHHYTAVLTPTEAGGLQSLALSDAVRSRIDGDTLAIPPELSPDLEDLDGPRTYEDVDTSLFFGPGSRLETVLVYPLGDHGIVGIGSTEAGGGFSDDDERFAGILCNAAETAMDRAAREAEIRQNRQKLEQRNQQIEFFNGILRHDILNGIMIIQGNADLLTDHVDEAGQPKLDAVQQWADDIKELTTEIRSIVKTIADEEDPEIEPVDLTAAIRSSTAKVGDTYDDVDLTVDVTADHVVRANDLLSQVLENVLLNAVEHNDAETPRIAVSATEVDGRVVVRVADNGPGIPDTEKDAVFDSEYTSDASETYGYGLYFVKTMVDSYGGDVYFEDSDMGGAEAVLEFATVH